MDNRRRMMLAGGISADPVLENNDWETISAISKAGKAAEIWSIGDTKTRTSFSNTYTVRIIGFDHDDVTDAASYGRAKAGITFELTEIRVKGIVHSSYPMSGGWGSCQLRNTTLPNYFNSLATDLQNVIIPVNKPYALSSGSILNASDKLFLLSEYEISGKNSYGNAKEGIRYDYYAAGNSRIKKYNGTNSYYWTRTAADTNIYYFVVHKNTNQSYNRAYVDSSYGVAFAFCV